MSDAPARLAALQAAADEARRRLAETQQQSRNYEDLLTALRETLQHHANERDNLRDEVVPALRARVEGLEAAAAAHETRAYDHARLQQELAALRLAAAAASGARSPIGRIAEEGAGGARGIDDVIVSPTTPKIGLSRSASLMRASGSGRPLSRSNSITGPRSAGVGASGGERESRDSLADRVRDVEAQRDALHGALRSLLERQAHQAREHAARVRGLEAERDRAVAAHTPRRRGFEAEVTGLRSEITALRRRADDALEAKWQCEKGLGGLKMDLDRAESETGSLRRLLAEHDILVPDSADGAAAAKGEKDGKTLGAEMAAADATSATLEHAHRALRDAHARSVAKLQSLSSSTSPNPPDAASPTADLAEQLRASAQRIDALSAHVRAQLAANAELRARLAAAVGSGERAQRASAARITGLQGRLRQLEERVTSAQARSEEGLAGCEADVRALRDADGKGRLRRRPAGGPVAVTGKSAGGEGKLGSGGRSPVVGRGGRSPRLDRTSSGPGVGMNEALRTAALEGRVRELERALAEAEGEMGEVVQRMNAAQIEVAELQSARYVAIPSFPAPSWRPRVFGRIGSADRLIATRPRSRPAPCRTASPPSRSRSSAASPASSRTPACRRSRRARTRGTERAGHSDSPLVLARPDGADADCESRQPTTAVAKQENADHGDDGPPVRHVRLSDSGEHANRPSTCLTV